MKNKRNIGFTSLLKAAAAFPPSRSPRFSPRRWKYRFNDQFSPEKRSFGIILNPTRGLRVRPPPLRDRTSTRERPGRRHPGKRAWGPHGGGGTVRGHGDIRCSVGETGAEALSRPMASRPCLVIRQVTGVRWAGLVAARAVCSALIELVLSLGLQRVDFVLKRLVRSQKQRDEESGGPALCREVAPSEFGRRAGLRRTPFEPGLRRSCRGQRRLLLELCWFLLWFYWFQFFRSASLTHPLLEPQWVHHHQRAAVKTPRSPPRCHVMWYDLIGSDVMQYNDIIISLIKTYYILMVVMKFWNCIDI